MVVERNPSLPLPLVIYSFYYIFSCRIKNVICSREICSVFFFVYFQLPITTDEVKELTQEHLVFPEINSVT